MLLLNSTLTLINGDDRDTGADAYWQFYDSVTRQQVLDWLPEQRSLVIDVSGEGGRYAAHAAARGHAVVHADQRPAGSHPLRTPSGVQVVRCDSPDVGWLQPGVADAVLAEGSTLSRSLATEYALGRIARVLRPGGQLMVSVDSLMLGLAQLAEQQRWAELADVPAADVVLVPADGGSITRCFWPEQLAEVLDESGFDVQWIRPRTVLSPEPVRSALAANPAALESLVRTELALATERQGESAGYQLVAAGVRR
jgi:hypothetical protein